MVKIKKICGREFKYFEDGENGCKHDSGIYEYHGNRIAKEWIDVGWTNRWGEYRETTVQRWVIIGNRPYSTHNYKSITEAADHIR